MENAFNQSGVNRILIYGSHFSGIDRLAHGLVGYDEHGNPVLDRLEEIGQGGINSLNTFTALAGPAAAAAPKVVVLRRKHFPKSGRIAGQSPNVSPSLQRNPNGLIRSEDEIIDVLTSNGIEIPDDVAVMIDDTLNGTFDDLIAGNGDVTTARMTRLREDESGLVRFKDLFNKKTGKMPVYLNPELLEQFSFYCSWYPQCLK